MAECNTFREGEDAAGIAEGPSNRALHQDGAKGPSNAVEGCADGVEDAVDSGEATFVNGGVVQAAGCIYQPGGSGEKSLILRQLQEVKRGKSMADLANGLRLLFALLSLWGAPPLPSFAAQHDALGLVLVRGVHRFPEEHESRFHITRAPHDTPGSFYTGAFIHPLRLWALAALDLPTADIQAIEQATRTALLSLPLIQALDFLHTQLLAGLCVAG